MALLMFARATRAQPVTEQMLIWKRAGSIFAFCAALVGAGMYFLFPRQTSASLAREIVRSIQENRFESVLRHNDSSEWTGLRISRGGALSVMKNFVGPAYGGSTPVGVIAVEEFPAQGMASAELALVSKSGYKAGIRLYRHNDSRRIQLPRVVK